MNATNPQRVIPLLKLEKAKEYFEYGMEKTEDFYFYFKIGLEEKKYKTAALQLHQAIESCYNTFLLVFNDYEAQTHDLEELRKNAIQIHKDHIKVFAINNQEDKDRWELLCKAYSERDYTITAEELKCLGEQTRLLIELTKQLSRESLNRTEIRILYP